MSEPNLTQRPPASVLVFVAHADDIEFGASGSIARWVKEGAQVTYCIVTDNSSGSNDPAVDTTWLTKKREEEQRASAAVVGVKDVRFLGYRDGDLQPTMELRRELTRLIRELRPERVLCPDPTTVLVEDFYVNHPDHRAVGEAALYAVFPSAGTRPIFTDLLAEGYEPHDVQDLYLMLSNQSNIVVDITETIDLKIKALLCHESQVGSDVEKEVREYGVEDGKSAGYAYGESFRVMHIRGDDRQRTDQAG
jgi:LmbE family N-acetylglucosaminyl deacetylase